MDNDYTNGKEGLVNVRVLLTIEKNFNITSKSTLYVLQNEAVCIYNNLDSDIRKQVTLPNEWVKEIKNRFKKKDKLSEEDIKDILDDNDGWVITNFQVQQE